MTIDLSCPACGSNRVAFNHAVSDDCEVACEACGANMGTFGALKRRVARQMGRPD